MSIRPVSIVGIGQTPVVRTSPQSLRELGAKAARLAMDNARVHNC